MDELETSTLPSLDQGLWKRILTILWTFKKDVLILFSFMVTLALGDVIFPLFNRFALDEFITAQRYIKYIPLFALLYVTLIVVQTTMVYLFIKQAGKIEMNFAYTMRKMAFEKLQRLSFSYYDTHASGWILSRLTSDINRLSEIVSWGLLDMVWGLAMMVGISVVMLLINAYLALIVLVMVPILYVIARYFQKQILKAYREVRKINSMITADFSEMIFGIKSIKTLTIEKQRKEKFSTLASDMKTKSIRSALFSSLFMPIVFALASISSATLLSVGGQAVLIGTLGLGTLLLYVQYVNAFFEPLRNIARILAEMQMAQASAERVLSLLDAKEDIIDNNHGEVYEPLHGDIVFDKVSFHYIEGEPVLKDFSLHIKAGQTLALVGESGGGKSTIVNLLCRFYEPTSGEIRIDGFNIQNRPLQWLRSSLGYVLQTPHLFMGTIASNIAYGRPDASMEDIMAAAKAVHAHDFIMKLDQGYETPVLEGGAKLSVGEKQLLSFARALCANPSLIILDEATASIDSHHESMVQEAIKSLLKDKTSVVVAHRLSTIVNADVICVISKGQIVESGTHSELIAKQGRYYELYTHQFEQFEEE
ncbi:MAG: ABC transporter ATP-binding protein [Erysipelothrix sp.]|nr:ABC transporter ATP-binding protein [Erysipelothrix sp.]